MEKRFLAPAGIADAMIGVGKGKCSLKTVQMLLLGIFAGAFIAFGAFACGMISHSIENVGLAKFAGAAVFPVGLMLVVMCGAELFTGNNLIAVAYLNKDVTLSQMLKNWVVVYRQPDRFTNNSVPDHRLGPFGHQRGRSWSDCHQGGQRQGKPDLRPGSNTRYLM